MFSFLPGRMATPGPLPRMGRGEAPEPEDRVVLVRYTIADSFFDYVPQLEGTWDPNIVLAFSGYGMSSLFSQVGVKTLDYLHPEVVDPELEKALQETMLNVNMWDEDSQTWVEALPDSNKATIIFNKDIATVSPTREVYDLVVRTADGQEFPWDPGLTININPDVPPPWVTGAVLEILGKIRDYIPIDIHIGYSIPVPNHGVLSNGLTFIHGATGRMRGENMNEAMALKGARCVSRVDRVLYMVSGYDLSNSVTSMVNADGELWHSRNGGIPARLATGIQYAVIAQHKWDDNNAANVQYLTIKNDGSAGVVNSTGVFYDGISPLPSGIASPGSQVISLAGAGRRDLPNEVMALFAALTANGDVHIWGDYATNNLWPAVTNVPQALSVAFYHNSRLLPEPGPAIIITVEGGDLYAITASGLSKVRSGVREYCTSYPLSNNFLESFEMVILGDDTVEMLGSEGKYVITDNAAFLVGDGVVRKDGVFVHTPVAGRPPNPLPRRIRTPIKTPAYIPVDRKPDYSGYAPLGGAGYQTPVHPTLRSCIRGEGPWFGYIDKQGALTYCDIVDFMMNQSQSVRFSYLPTSTNSNRLGSQAPLPDVMREGVVGFTSNIWVANSPFEGMSVGDVFTLYDGSITSAYYDSMRSGDFPSKIVNGPTRGAVGALYWKMDGTVGAVEKVAGTVQIPDSIAGKQVLSIQGLDETMSGRVGDAIFDKEVGGSTPGSGTRTIGEVLRNGALSVAAVVQGDEGRFVARYVHGFRYSLASDNPPIPPGNTYMLPLLHELRSEPDNTLQSIAQYIRQTSYLRDNLMLIASYGHDTPVSYNTPIAYVQDTTGTVREMFAGYKADLSMRNTFWFQDRLPISRFFDVGGVGDTGGGLRTEDNLTDAIGGILKSDPTKVVLRNTNGKSFKWQQAGFPGYTKQDVPPTGVTIDFGKEVKWVSAMQISVRATPAPGGLAGSGFYVVTAAFADGSVSAQAVKSVMTTSPANNLVRTMELFGSVRQILPPGTVNTDIGFGLPDLTPPATGWGSNWGGPYGE